MSARYYVVAMLLASLLSTCTDESTQPPSYAPYIGVEVLDALCTEAWIGVQLAAGLQPRALTLQRDSQTVLNFMLTGTETLIVDDGLLPSQSYSYTLTRDNGEFVEHVTANATTMDTTSHNFTWQMDTLGVTSSVLSDVAIINDTLAYVVGEMYLRDSTGQLDPIFYNLARWNGQQWILQKILYNGGPFVGRWLLAFSENDIWVNEHAHWDGTTWNFLFVGNPIFDGVRTNKAWGTSSNDFYVVGDNGFIAHYNGATWQSIGSMTGLNVRDIWSAANPRTGEEEILALASTNAPPVQGSMVLKIAGSSATPVSTTGMSPDMLGIWFVPERRYYAVGAGIHQKRMLTDSAWNVYPPGVVTRFLSGGVRGQGINNVFVVGSFGEVVHFNGQSWFRYFSDIPLPTGALGGISVRDPLVLTVGLLGTGTGTRGIVLIGRR